jgi:capsular exopolysaccharide synthesis family protein
MEKIKTALERARKARGGVASTERRVSKSLTKRVEKESSKKIVYTNTKVIDVNHKALKENCIILDSENSNVSESYKVLRTQVLQRMRVNKWTTLAVASPTAGEGKTVTAINLAISLSREVNQTVLLVDLDLRDPSIHKYFDLDESHPGINHYLDGKKELNEVLFNPGLERLVVLPGRDKVPHSSEMLSSPKMVGLVKELKSFYPGRLVIFDMPPILVCDDMLAFSPYVDSIMLVIEDKKTRKKDLTRTIQLIEQDKLLGTVLNKSRSNEIKQSYY